MKTSCFVIALLASTLAGVQAQVTGTGATTTVKQTVLPAPTPYSVVQRAANNRVWERTVYEQGPNGTVVPKKHHYTEMAAGMHFWSNGRWVESKEQINVLPRGGAAATQGQHQVNFPGDIYKGVIEMVTPDGTHLKSRPMGISYDDGDNTVLIAQLKDSVGVLVSPNKIVYPDAFTGLKADLVCTYRKGRFESDLVFREQPPLPEAYGLSSQSSRLQLLTEFFDTPEPVQKFAAAGLQNGLRETTLQFGSMIMGHGKAFVAGTAQPDPASEITVFKSWLHLGGRTFLVEEVPFQRMASCLQSLPMTAMNGTIPANSVLHKVSSTRLLVPARLAQKDSTHVVQVAKADLNPKPGVVLDYVLVDTDPGDFTFQADTTYYIANGIDFNGNLVFEGGTVIKYGTDPNNPTCMECWGNINCDTDPYHPAIFTSVNDNSVGESISQPGTPMTYWNALCGDSSSSTQWRYIHVRYARYGIVGNGHLSLSDSQFVDCVYPFFVYWGPCYFTNDLVVNAGNVFYGNAFAATVYHMTIDNCTNQLVVDFWGEDASTVSFVNSLLVNTGTAGAATVTTDYTAWLASSSGVFQSVGAGICYLATNSPYHNAGTTNVDASVLSHIQTKTTYPPIVYSNTTIYASMTFDPQAQRDNGDAPDLGYHYVPLDYEFLATIVTNATVMINPGTAIGMAGTAASGGWSILLNGGAQFISQGLATNPVHIVCFNTVQEQAMFYVNWSEPYNGMLGDWWISPIAINCRFTDWSVLAGPYCPYTYTLLGNEAVAFRDCEFHAGYLQTYNPSINLTNCLFERVDLEMYPQDNNTPIIRNCLFWHGTFGYSPWTTTGNAIVADNLFDQTVIPDWMGGWGATYSGGHNAYVTNCDTLDPIKTGDIILANPLAYQSSFLGHYYQPSDSPLVDAGSTTADQVGLYHYTTQTTQVPEGVSTVDIGYHYVATDAYGNPLDTNGDGIPDYLEDANGNGIFDAGDLGNWLSCGSGPLTFPNGMTIQIFEPKPVSAVP